MVLSRTLEARALGGRACQAPGEALLQHPPQSQRGGGAQAKHPSHLILRFFHLSSNAASGTFKRSFKNTDLWFWQHSKPNKGRTSSPTIDTNTETLRKSHQHNSNIMMLNYKVRFPPQKIILERESSHSSPSKSFFHLGKPHLPEMTPAILLWDA